MSFPLYSILKSLNSLCCSRYYLDQGDCTYLEGYHSQLKSLASIRGIERLRRSSWTISSTWVWVGLVGRYFFHSLQRGHTYTHTHTGSSAIHISNLKPAWDIGRQLNCRRGIKETWIVNPIQRNFNSTQPWNWLDIGIIRQPESIEIHFSIYVPSNWWRVLFRQKSEKNREIQDHNITTGTLSYRER